jgi:hypothetical protein
MGDGGVFGFTSLYLSSVCYLSQAGEHNDQSLRG